jgi:hypothetical protein
VLLIDETAHFSSAAGCIHPIQQRLVLLREPTYAEVENTGGLVLLSQGPAEVVTTAGCYIVASSCSISGAFHTPKPGGGG